MNRNTMTAPHKPSRVPADTLLEPPDFREEVRGDMMNGQRPFSHGTDPAKLRLVSTAITCMRQWPPSRPVRCLGRGSGGQGRNRTVISILPTTPFLFESSLRRPRSPSVVPSDCATVHESDFLYFSHGVYLKD